MIGLVLAGIALAELAFAAYFLLSTRLKKIYSLQKI